MTVRDTSRSGNPDVTSFDAYVPDILAGWDLDHADEDCQEREATCCYVDISGFTSISERLARLGRLGAERLTELLDDVFARMLTVAAHKGGSLLKFGGDSLLVVFEGTAHQRLAVEAAIAMRAELAKTTSSRTDVGKVRLRASMGVHSGTFLFFRVGALHHELVVAGPATTATIELEQHAGPGEILIGAATAGSLPARAVGAARGGGFLLRTRTVTDDGPGPPRRASDATSVAASVPSGVREWLASRAGESEHRLATVAFMRLQGVDALIATEGPHATAAAISEVVAAVQEAAEVEGVTFLGSDIDVNGAKLIVVAGVPVARDDDEGRVLRTVRRVADQRFRLELQVGVNRDHVFAGDVGTSWRRTFTVMGDGVNVAARLAAAAAPGAVLASASVLDHSRTEFATTELGALSVKGKEHPVPTWQVAQPTGVKSATFGSLEFLGRDDELATLTASLDGLATGSGSVAVIEGERGMGKSRLVSELRPDHVGARPIVLQGEPFGEATPFLPLRAPMREILEVTATDPAEAGIQLMATVRSIAPELVQFASLLAPLVDAELAATPETEALGDRFVRSRVVELFVAVVAAACRGPVLVIAEDAHWFDETSTELCEGLAAAARDHPWMVCATRRPLGGGFTPSAPDVSLSLARLTDGVARALVERATEAAPLRPHDRDRLVAQASGNPLFIEELLRIARTSTIEALPDSLDSIAMREIDALPGPARRVLLVAAVLGRVFPRALLAELVDEELDGVGEVLLAQGADDLRFRHALLQEAAYQSLPYRVRVDLHLRTGLAIERSAQRPDDVAPLLSWHFHQAQDWTRTWRYAGLAARVALLAHAPGEAVAHLERAVEAARRLGTVPCDEIVSALVELGDALVVLGDYDRADDAYHRAALAAPDDHVARARMAHRRAYLRTEYQGRLTAALRQARAGIALLDAIPNPPAEAGQVRAKLVVREAVVRYRQGRLRESMTLSNEAIEESERVGDLRSLALALSLYDQGLAELGRASEASRMVRALSIFEELGDYVDAAMTLGNLGSIAFYQSLWTHAADYFDRAVHAATAAGDLATAAVAETNLGELRVNQGDYAAAVGLLVPARRTLESFGFRAGIAQATMHLGRARAFLGETEAGCDLVSSSARQFADAGMQMAALEARAHLAEVLVHARELHKARAALGIARAAEGSLGESPVSALLDRVEVTLLVAEGRNDAALARLDEATRRAERLGATYEVFVLLVVECRLGVDARADDREALARDLGIVGVSELIGT